MGGWVGGLVGVWMVGWLVGCLFLFFVFFTANTNALVMVSSRENESPGSLDPAFAGARRVEAEEGPCTLEGGVWKLGLRCLSAV